MYCIYIVILASVVSRSQFIDSHTSETYSHIRATVTKQLAVHHFNKVRLAVHVDNTSHPLHPQMFLNSSACDLLIAAVCAFTVSVNSSITADTPATQPSVRAGIMTPLRE